jgi:hypothetical protein
MSVGAMDWEPRQLFGASVVGAFRVRGQLHSNGA